MNVIFSRPPDYEPQEFADGTSDEEIQAAFEAWLFEGAGWWIDEGPEVA